MSKEQTLYVEQYDTLDAWHCEGIAGMSLRRGVGMLLECVDSRQGSAGCNVFCRREFPDRIAVEFSLRVAESDGLVITFLAVRGLHGEDAIAGLPQRIGEFKDYVGEDARIRSYHVSVSRYDDQGVHTGVSNWRRNPGLHLMDQGVDLCSEVGRQYAVRIEKNGASCALFVDGMPGPAFTDPDSLPDEIPSSGKIGFRAIGSRVIAEISGFRVSSLV